MGPGGNSWWIAEPKGLSRLYVEGRRRGREEGEQVLCLFIHYQGCGREMEIKVGEMSSFDIHVFRGVGRDCGPGGFRSSRERNASGEAQLLHPGSGAGTGQRRLGKPLRCFTPPRAERILLPNLSRGASAPHLTPRL